MTNPNLVATPITDKNGKSTLVYKTTDGRGRPNHNERNSAKLAAVKVPRQSPYQKLNVAYADDKPIGERTIHNEYGSLRVHEDGTAELVSYEVRNNMELSPDDISSLINLSDKYRDTDDYEPKDDAIELSSGAYCRYLRDGSLLILESDRERESVLSGSESSKLINLLRKI